MRKTMKWFLTLMLVAAMVFGAVAVMAAEAPALPTATVTEITNENLTFALNFSADQATAEQLEYYGNWYADFELTTNKDITLYSGDDAAADGYLGGQYDGSWEDENTSWNGQWVYGPFKEPVTVKAGETVKVMAFAAEMMGEPGLKYTYKEVYEVVKNFDCGMFVSEEYQQANPDFEVTLALCAYNNQNEAERYQIGRSYTFRIGYVAENVQTGVKYDDVSDAMQAAAAGQTVKLLNNAEDIILTVKEDTILDLNGYELTANYVSVFGHMIDGSESNNGALKVDANKLLINTANKQLPVKTDKGYQFVEIIGFNTAWMNETTFVFQPLFEATAHEMLKNGVAVTGVSIQVEVTWRPYAGSEDLDSRTFKYGDTLVTQYINSYKAATGKYGRMFTLTLVNPENYVELACNTKVVSDTRVVFAPASVPAEVTEEVQLTNEQASAIVPVGTKLKNAGSELILNTTEMEQTTSDVVLTDGETMLSMDVHVDGIAEDNTVPVIVTLNEITVNGLNEGNIALYHVENGETVKMTRVYAIEEVDEHNEYYYDIATGTITMALKSFSEVAVVAETSKVWEGKIAETLPMDDAGNYLIYNADQLAKFGAMVDAGETFAGKTVILCLDVNLGGDKVKETGTSFNPIGYGYEFNSGKVFKGTFDGNGNTIYNLFQNGWALEKNYTGEDYTNSTAGGGLFASVVDANIKNLTVDGAFVVMECVDMGVVVGYANGNCTFENIVVKNSLIANYQRCTGGAIGELGNGHHVLKNVDVDAGTYVSSLWGDFDAPLGGIVGGIWEHGYNNLTGDPEIGAYKVTAIMEGCDVAATINAYNDVTSAYQWYSYRRAGMLIGLSGYSTKDANGRTSATAPYLVTKNCTVQYGDWVNYHYCEFGDTTSLGAKYPWVRVEPGYSCGAYSNVRYGVPQFTDMTLDTSEGHIEAKDCHNTNDGHYQLIKFNQLYGGGQGCYGGNEHVCTQCDSNVEHECTGAKVIGQTTATPKFEYIGTNKIVTGSTVTLGELFKAIVKDEDIQDPYVFASVSPADKDSKVEVFSTDRVDPTTNWEDLQLSFNGTGKAKIIISDYFYCEPTVIEVTVDYANSVILHDAEGVRRLGFNDSVKLPEGSAVEGRTFYGWSETLIAEAISTEPTIFAAGTQYTKSGTDHLYAVYTYAETSAGSTTYEKYSGTITEGDYLIVYDSSAMKNTISSERLSYEAITTINNKVTSEVGDNIVWHIAPSGSYWTIYNETTGKYAASTGAKNKAQLLTSGTDNKSLWTVSGSSTYEFVNKANKTNNINANLRKNGTYGFATYGTSTGGALTLYKATTTQGILTNFYISICEPCDHVNKITDIKAATCTEAGYKTVTCADCGHVISDEVYEILEHNYVNGVCSMCQKEESDYAQVTDINDITNGDYVIAVKVGNTYYAMGTQLNEKNKIVPQVIVVGSDNRVETENAPIWKISVSTNGISLNNGSVYLKSGSSTNFATSSAAAVWTIAEVNDSGTFTIKSTTETDRGILFSEEVTPNVFGHYANSNYGKTDYYGDLYLFKAGSVVGCDHANSTTVTTDATCAKAGSIVTTCNDCGHVTTETIPALPHSYENGICTGCGAAEVIVPEIPETGVYKLVTDIEEIKNGGQFVIVAVVGDKYIAMDAYSTEDKAVLGEEVAVSGNYVTTVDAPTWTIGKFGENIALKGANGAYLKQSSKSEAQLSDSVSEPYAWTVLAVDEINGVFHIASALELDRGITYRTGTYNYFRSYILKNTSDYHPNLKLYELVEGEIEVCEHTNTTTTTVDATCIGAGSVTVTCVDCGETVSTTEIPATGNHTYGADGVCTTDGCNETKPVAGFQKASSIAVGDKIVIVCESKQMELNGITSNYGAGVNYTRAPVGKYVLTVEAGYTSGTFAFRTSDGEYLSWSSSNSLTTSTTKNANSSWTVTFSGGNAVIVNAKDNARKLQWNASAPRFACYTTSQTAVQLYKEN